MKKIIFFFLSFSLLFSLSSCEKLNINPEEENGPEPEPAEVIVIFEIEIDYQDDYMTFYFWRTFLSSDSLTTRTATAFGLKTIEVKDLDETRPVFIRRELVFQGKEAEDLIGKKYFAHSNLSVRRVHWWRHRREGKEITIQEGEQTVSFTAIANMDY